MLWINDVEMVDSLGRILILAINCWEFSQFFEMLDARIASALNKIIKNSHFKNKVTLEEHEAQKEDRFLQGRQIAFMIYHYCRAIGAHDTVLDYADLFSVTLRFSGIRYKMGRSFMIFHRYHLVMSWLKLKTMVKRRYSGCETLTPQ